MQVIRVYDVRVTTPDGSFHLGTFNSTSETRAIKQARSQCKRQNMALRGQWLANLVPDAHIENLAAWLD